MCAQMISKPRVWCRSRISGAARKSRFSASKSGYGQGKGSSRVEGGCCTVCASKFYGPSGYGAPPFSEPGNAMQNAGAGGFMRPPKAPAPPASKKGGGK